MSSARGRLVLVSGHIVRWSTVHLPEITTASEQSQVCSRAVLQRTAPRRVAAQLTQNALARPFVRDRPQQRAKKEKRRDRRFSIEDRLTLELAPVSMPSRQPGAYIRSFFIIIIFCSQALRNVVRDQCMVRMYEVL